MGAKAPLPEQQRERGGGDINETRKLRMSSVSNQSQFFFMKWSTSSARLGRTTCVTAQNVVNKEGTVKGKARLRDQDRAEHLQNLAQTAFRYRHGWLAATSKLLLTNGQYWWNMYHYCCLLTARPPASRGEGESANRLKPSPQKQQPTGLHAFWLRLRLGYCNCNCSLNKNSKSPREIFIYFSHF